MAGRGRGEGGRGFSGYNRGGGGREDVGGDRPGFGGSSRGGGDARILGYGGREVGDRRSGFRGEEGPQGGQEELATRTLVLEGKRFHLDVKENQRGRFLKIAEISADGRYSIFCLRISCW